MAVSSGSYIQDLEQHGFFAFCSSVSFGVLKHGKLCCVHICHWAYILHVLVIPHPFSIFSQLAFFLVYSKEFINLCVLFKFLQRFSVILFQFHLKILQFCYYPCTYMAIVKNGNLDYWFECSGLRLILTDEKIDFTMNQGTPTVSCMRIFYVTLSTRIHIPRSHFPSKRNIFFVQSFLFSIMHPIRSIGCVLRNVRYLYSKWFFHPQIVQLIYWCTTLLCSCLVSISCRVSRIWIWNVWAKF